MRIERRYYDQNYEDVTEDKGKTGLKADKERTVVMRDLRKTALFKLLKYKALDLARDCGANTTVEWDENRGWIEMEMNELHLSNDENAYTSMEFSDLLSNSTYTTFTVKNGILHLLLWYDFQEDFYID